MPRRIPHWVTLAKRLSLRRYYVSFLPLLQAPFLTFVHSNLAFVLSTCLAYISNHLLINNCDKVSRCHEWEWTCTYYLRNLKHWPLPGRPHYNFVTSPTNILFRCSGNILRHFPNLGSLIKLLPLCEDFPHPIISTPCRRASSNRWVRISVVSYPNLYDAPQSSPLRIRLPLPQDTFSLL